jgi:hypothetical protein
VADLLAAAKGPWEHAFSQEYCLKAWASIGVSPFNEKVFWDLRAAEAKAEKVFADHDVNIDMLNLKGMIQVMYGAERSSVQPEQAAQSSRRRKREACLHSSHLWHLPGGATGDECFEIVKAKTEAKLAKVDACKAAKARRLEGKAEKRAASISLGAEVIASLTHVSQVSKLKLPALNAALAFKGVDAPHGVKKAVLAELLKSKLNLPSDSSNASALPCASATALASLMVVSAHDMADSGSDDAESDESEDDL